MFLEGLDPAKHGINHPAPSQGPTASLAVFVKLLKNVRSGFHLFKKAKNTDTKEIRVFTKVNSEEGVLLLQVTGYKLRLTVLS